MFAWIQRLLLLLLLLLTCPRLVLPEKIIGSVPPLPSQGVRLYSGLHNTSIPNYSIIAARDFMDGDSDYDGMNDGLWCQSANDAGDSEGVWYYPNGSVVLSTDIDAGDPRLNPLHVCMASGQTGLQRDGGLVMFSGLFMCNISDEKGIGHTLIVGAFTNSVFDNMGAPSLSGSVALSLLSTREADPPVFSVSFNVSNSLPTYTECDIDGVAVDNDSEANITREVIQALPPVLTTVTLFMKQRTQGAYTCIVSAAGIGGILSQSNMTTYITVVDFPTNFVSARTGPNTANVSWSAPLNNTSLVAGYEVLYETETGETISGGETSAPQLSLVLTSLQPDMSYTAFVVAFGSGSTLPSAHSNTFWIPTYSATQPSVELSDQSVTLGLNATFACNATGFGLSHFSWTHPPTSRPVDIVNNTLTVVGVSREEEGTYNCTVSDDSGNTAWSSASLQVNGPELLTDANLNYVVQANMNFNISCTAVSPVDAPAILTVHWLFNGMSTDSVENLLDSTSTAGDGTVTSSLLFIPAELSNSGEYICRATLYVSEDISDTVQSPIIAVTVLGPPGAPVSFTSTTNYSRNVTLEWEPPVLTTDNGQLEGYLLHCEESLTRALVADFSHKTVLNEMVLTLTGLTAFTSYTCFLSALTAGGEGAASELTWVTAEEAPQDSPQGLAVVSSGAFFLQLSWSPPSQANGIITHYTLTVEFSNGSDPLVVEIGSDQLTFNVSGLSPYQMISVTLSASTTAGEGPTVANTFFTDEYIPGPVSSLTLTVLNVSSITVLWSGVPVALANGIVQGYRVVLQEYQGEDIAERIINSSELVTTFLNLLRKETPFEVTVSAFNGNGLSGLSQSKVFFTQEGTPPAPTSVTSLRINGSHTIVNWDLIPLIKARGFITEYSVILQQGNDFRRQLVSYVVSSDSDHVIIGGLKPYSSYRVFVSASTSVGIGVSSAEITLEALPREKFQVRGGAFQECTNWNVTMRSSVESFIVSAVVSAVQHYCQCDFQNMYVSGPELLCDEQESNWVVLTANVTNYGEHSAQQLIGHIHDWVTQGATATSGLAVIMFDPNCPVTIPPGAVASCPVASPTACLEPTASSSLPTDSQIISVPFMIAMTAVITMLFTAIAIISIVLVVACVLRKHSRLNARQSVLNRQFDQEFPANRYQFKMSECGAYESFRKPSTHRAVVAGSKSPVTSSHGHNTPKNSQPALVGDVHNPVYAATAELPTCTERIYETLPGEEY